MTSSTQWMVVATIAAVLSSNAAQAAAPTGNTPVFVLAPVIITAHRIDAAHRQRLVQSESRKPASERLRVHG